MAEFQIKKGAILFEHGTKVAVMAHIIEGHVLMRLSGTNIELFKDDIIGLIDLNTHIHSCDYISLEDTIIETIPCNNFNDISHFLIKSDKSTIAYASFYHQMHALLDAYHLMRYDCNNMYVYLHNCYEEYFTFCKNAIITPRELPGLQDFPSLSLDEIVDNWKLEYYKDYKAFFENSSPDQLATYPNFFIGLLRIGCDDVHKLLNSFRIMHDYIRDLSYFLLNENGTDLLALYCALLLSIARDGNDTNPVLNSLSRLLFHIENIPSINKTLYRERRSQYNKIIEKIDSISAMKADIALQKKLAKTTDLLKNSVDIILQFANYNEEKAFQFKHALKDYINLEEKSSTSEEAVAIRDKLTTYFYELYTVVFLLSLKTNTIPPVVWMFLQFGYVDEKLAGIENAAYLYSLYGNYHGNASLGVYTFYEWLLAIYNGKKEPRRNEMDVDFKGYLKELESYGNITKTQKEQMSHDPIQKIMFELNNLFPVANRITYGRITTFCPVFSEHNVSKSLEECLVSAESVCKSLNFIRSIDYSAFYRPTLYTNPDFKIHMEFIQKEILPDVILFPNVGIRGSVWQEIEGKNRSTPATFLLPIFTLENLQLIFTRLTGEFRWEMCKRVQGSKWNDVTDHSLTSDYFDYLQFYRKNNELSSDMKEKCHAQLKKCKNSFKEFFIFDYMLWILYESNGTPRLNRYVRTMLFTYCPFKAPIRQKLLTNPLYEQTMAKAAIKLEKEKRRFDGLIQKTRSRYGTCPPELEAQRSFLDY